MIPVLKGARVLITRGIEDCGDLPDLIVASGGEVLCIPMTAVAAPEDTSALDAARAGIARYDWIALTSRNGARALLRGVAMPAEGTRPRVAAVGKRTAKAARDAGWTVDLVGKGRGGSELADEMIRRDAMKGKAVLHPRSDLARDDLMDRLTAAGARVEAVVAYRTRPAPPPEGAALADLRESRFDVAVFASPSAVASLLEAAGPAFLEKPAVAIGATSAAALRGAGASAVTESSSPDPADLHDAVTRAWNSMEREGRFKQ